MIAKTLILEPLPLFLYRTTDSTVKRHRIYIIPTRYGFFFGLMLFAMLMGAVNYNNSMAYILTFFLSSLALVAILHTYRNLAGLRMEQANVSAVFCGDIAHFPLLLDNQHAHSRLSVCFAKVPRGRWPFLSAVVRSKSTQIATCNIHQNSLDRVELLLPATQRGKFTAGRIKVYTNFPLGLLIAWSYIDMQRSCLVYPKPAGSKHLPLAKLSECRGTQGHGVGTDDFVGFRNYHVGDSVKDIAWKIYAQHKGLLVKQFSGSGTDKLQLSWDSIRHITNIEARLSQLCLWLIEAEAQSVQYALDMPGRHTKFTQGDKHLHHCLSLLAEYNQREWYAK